MRKFNSVNFISATCNHSPEYFTVQTMVQTERVDGHFKRDDRV